MYLKWLILAAVAGLLPSLPGCGGSPAQISGRVDFDGQPVANGRIKFTPEDGKGPVVGVQISEGRYRIDDITPGKKIVEIIGMKKVNFARSHEEMAQAAKENAKHGDSSGIVERADEIPPDAAGNNRVVEVQRGHTELNFSLKRPATPPVAK